MTLTIGHRGAAFLEPENTLRGFRRAIEIGVDYVEFDIHRCKSGELVVIHDETVDRTTNGNGFVRDLTLQQLIELDAGKGEHIPTLQQVIDACRGRIRMYVELKDHGLEEDVIAAISRNRIVNDVIIKSFYHEAVLRAKEIAEAQRIDVKTGVLIAGNPVNIIEVARAARADYVSSNHYFTDKRMVDAVKKAGMGMTVWNCDTEYDINRMVKLGVDAICSNRPDLLMKVLGRK